MPLRFVHGPCGWGKTTALVLYARAQTVPVAFVRVRAGGDLTDVLAAFGELVGGPVTSFEELLARLEASPVREVIVDGIDTVQEEALAELSRWPELLPPSIHLLYAARARGALDLLPAITGGLAIVMDPQLLAFAPADIAQMCERLGVEHSAADTAHLAQAADGWPFVVSSVVRDAAAEARSLRGAYARWQARHRRLLEDLAVRSLDALLPEERPAAEALYAGIGPVDGVLFGRLANAGLLFAPDELELRPLRPITDCSQQRTPLRELARETEDGSGTAEIEMFGEFSMTIDGRAVNWFRRRDRQIMQYLALQPEARASREALIATFWPDGDPPLALQSLRSACSTIRRAIGQCAGSHRVDRFFVADREVALKLENVSTSNRRFRTHFRTGEEALRRGDGVRARAHFQIALRLYRAPLLVGEPPARWIVPELEELESMAAFADHYLTKGERVHLPAAFDRSEATAV